MAKIFLTNFHSKWYAYKIYLVYKIFHIQI